jgi:threonine dehydratase
VQALGPRAVNGVVACSSGNHAQGVSEAARLAGIRSVIVMPADAPVLKRERTGRSGARVVLYDREREDRDAIALAIAREEGLAFIHPYNDPDVIAGQGTAGLEIAADCAALGIAPDTLVVPCSGGGLAAGTTLAIKDRFPDAGVYVAEPRDFDDYARSLGAGSRQSNTLRGGSLCDALLAEMPGAIGWHINSKALAGGVGASDPEALYAVGFAFDELRLVVEPGGAVGLAALLAGQLETAGRTLIIMLSGGNVADDVLGVAIRAYRSGAAGPGPAS